MPNQIELTVVEEFNTRHAKAIQPAFGANTRCIFPLAVVKEITIDDAYDNPTMSLKD